MGVYELREELFVVCFTYPTRTYGCVQRIALRWIDDHLQNQVEAKGLKQRVARLLELDRLVKRPARSST